MNEPLPQNPLEVNPHSRSAGEANLFGVTLLYLVLILLIFSRCLTYPLLDWDDHLHLTDNPHLNPVSFEGLRKIWTEPYEGLYIPLSYTFFALEVSLTRLFDSQENSVLAPSIFHAGSLILHLVNSLLIYRILNLIVKNNRAACLGGLLFLLHPLQVESVVWISETRGLLSNFFSIAMIFYTLKYVVRTEASAADLPPSTTAPARKFNSELILATGCFLLSLLAKPSSVTTPLIIGILVYGFYPQQLKTLRYWIFCWLMLALTMILVNRSEQAELLFESPFWNRPLIAGDSLAFYLWKLFIPYPLMMQYDKSIKLILESDGVYWLWIIPCLCFLLACFVKQRRVWLVILAIFIAGLLPVLGLIPFAYQLVSTVADRYVYLSMFGPAFAVAWLLRDAHKTVARYSVCAVLAVFAGLSFIQTAAWANSVELYQHCLKYNPRAFIALNNLGHLAFKEQQFEKALHYFEKSITVMPDDAGTNLNLGATQMKLGNVDRALEFYKRVLEIDPQHPGAHVASGIYYESETDDKKAFDHYLQALQSQPQNADALMGLGNLARRQKNFKEALRYYQMALKFRPDDPDLRKNLGNLYLELGDEKNAQVQFELSRKQGSSDPVNEFNLGLMAARNSNLEKAIQHYESALQTMNQQTSPDLHKQIIQELALTYNLQGTMLQEQGNHQRAVIQLQLAIKTAPDLAPAFFNLAESLQQLGQTQAAIKALQQALTLVPPDSEPARDIQNRIDSYQNK
ncbi:MAG: tetratricopeptide repeat protein [Planctomycetota bacterium]